MNQIHICEYGCNREAKFQFKNGKWCCEKRWEQCPFKKRAVSEFHKGRISGMYNKHHSKKTREKISKSNKGKKKKPFSKETRKKMSESHKGKDVWNKGKTNIYSNTHLNKLRYSLKEYQEKYPLFCKIEELKEDLKTGEIQGYCKNHNCKNSKEKGGYFIPNRMQLSNRCKTIENGNGGSYFYCSEYCKNTCDLYGKSASQIMKQDLINAGHIKEENLNIPEYNIFKDEVFKRNIEEYGKLTCEYCGNTNKTELSIHHENPQKVNPEQILDPINGWVLCGFGKGNNCHYLLGHKPGTKCSIGFLRKLICEKKYNKNSYLFV